MKDKKRTQRSRIKAALRQLWLRSRERAQALKNNNYSCNKCGAKQSKAAGREQKVEVHHKEGIGNWDKVIELIQEEILCDPEKLEVLCPECHKEETYK
jgi:predicted HNH restriction endonuclease